MDDIQRSCREFTEALASSAPTPGGGGAAALIGALGASLGCMVAALTIGKQKYAAVQDEVAALQSFCNTLRESLLNEVEKDAEGFLPLAAAYRIPQNSPKRADALEKATINACRAPMRILELCCRVTGLLERLREIGARLAISDVGCAAAACRAAMQCAALNVQINLASMRDRETANTLRTQMQSMLREYEPRTDAILRAVTEELEGKR